MSSVRLSLIPYNYILFLMSSVRLSLIRYNYSLFNLLCPTQSHFL